MDLRAAIFEVHSEAQADKIARYIAKDAQRFSELMELLIGPVYRVSQRAAWPVSCCVERNAELVKSHFNVLIKQLERDDTHAAVRRNVARLFQFVEVPERYQGRLFDACYDLLDDPKQPVAVRVFSVTVAVKLAKDSPELIAELKLVATKYPSLMTPGVSSRIRRVFGEK